MIDLKQMKPTDGKIIIKTNETYNVIEQPIAYIEVFNQLEKIRRILALENKDVSLGVSETIPISEFHNYVEPTTKIDVKKEKELKINTKNINRGLKKMVKIGIPYLDEHTQIDIQKPDMLKSNLEELAYNNISEIINYLNTLKHTDKNKLTQQIMLLTEEFLKETDILKKREISNKIKTLKAEVGKREHKKEHNLQDVFTTFQQKDIEQLHKQLKNEINVYLNTIKSEYDQAIILASGSNNLIARINKQYIEDLKHVENAMDKILKESKEFIIKLHTFEAELLKEKMNEPIKPLDNSAYNVFDELIKQLHKQIQTIMGSKETVIESSFEESNEPNIVKEINSMKISNLLYKLRAIDRDTFLKYIKGQIDKEIAIQKAKRIIAKEKGLKDDEIDKYFPLGE